MSAGAEIRSTSVSRLRDHLLAVFSDIGIDANILKDIEQRKHLECQLLGLVENKKEKKWYYDCMRAPILYPSQYCPFQEKFDSTCQDSIFRAPVLKRVHTLTLFFMILSQSHVPDS
jgi:hypothetical protein